MAAGASMVEGGGMEAGGMEAEGMEQAHPGEAGMHGERIPRSRDRVRTGAGRRATLRATPRRPWNGWGSRTRSTTRARSCRGRPSTAVRSAVCGRTPRDEVASVVGQAQQAFEAWRTVPAPVRGELVRELGQLLREHKEDLGALVSIEAGKIVSEGLGEVQEMIDICDLAVGLSVAVRAHDRE